LKWFRLAIIGTIGRRFPAEISMSVLNVFRE
jgi:hypothetical protein